MPASDGSTISSDQLLDSLTRQSARAGKNASDLFSTGQGGADDLMSYFRKIFSGDREESYRATSEQTGTVTDQYDTAYQAVLQKGPRGGGRTSAAANLKGMEAGKVSEIIDSARPQAAQGLQALISSLLGASANESQISAGSLSSALSSLLQKEAADSQSWASLGLGAGKILASIAFPAK